MKEDLILDAPESGKRKKTVSYTLIYILIALVLTGFIFKALHWPGAGLLILFPSLIASSLLLHKFFVKMKKGISDYLVLVIVVWWLWYLMRAYLLY